MALVLGRRASESVVLDLGDGGNVIVITVARIQGSQVKLAIEAPAFVRIVRDELLEGSLAPSEPR